MVNYGGGYSAADRQAAYRERQGEVMSMLRRLYGLRRGRTAESLLEFRPDPSLEDLREFLVVLCGEEELHPARWGEGE